MWHCSKHCSLSSVHGLAAAFWPYNLRRRKSEGEEMLLVGNLVFTCAGGIYACGHCSKLVSVKSGIA